MQLKRWIRKLFKRRSSKAETSFKIVWYKKLSAAFDKSVNQLWDLLGKLTAPLAKLRRFFVPPAKPTKLEFLNPAFWIVWIFRFLIFWSSSRPSQDWIVSLPAVAAISIVFAGMVNYKFRPQSAKIEQYRSLFSRAVTKNDFAKAQVAVDVLRDLQPNDVAIMFSSALVSYDLGKKSEAISEISRIVDVHQYTEGAVWLLDHEFNIDTAESWTEAESERFEKYAGMALKYELTSSKAHNYLGRYYKEIGEFSVALSHFEKLLSEDPEYSFVTAQLYKNLGEESRATTLARKFERFFSDRIKRLPNVVSYRIKLAQLLIFQEREEAASQLLLEGFNYSRGEVQEYRIGAGEALVSKISRLANDNFSPVKFIQQIQLAKSSLVFAPDSKLVQESTNKLLKRIVEDKNSEQEYLRQALVAGQIPDSIHLVMGLLGVVIKDESLYELHLTLAMQSSTDLATILANLALCWSESDDWKQPSSDLIEFAFERDKRPAILGTRGQIREKLGQYDLAIQDLELALKSVESSLIYDSLSKAYEKTGRAELAKQARFRAESLKSRSNNASNASVVDKVQ